MSDSGAGVGKLWQTGQICTTTSFVNKVLLKERQWLLLPRNSQLITTQQRLHDPQSQKYLLSGAL